MSAIVGDMSEQELRVVAMNMAIKASITDPPPKDVVKKAKAFLAFLKAGGNKTKVPESTDAPITGPISWRSNRGLE